MYTGNGHQIPFLFGNYDKKKSFNCGFWISSLLVINYYTIL